MRFGRTFLLMLGLMLLFMYLGDLLGGQEGMQFAFLLALGLNFFGYFFSDTLVLKHYRAQKATRENAPELYQIVERLAMRAELPMPKVYIIPDKVPNAFATGRNPSHAAVAATQGLLDLMSEEEVEGVLAHEMSHVKNHDILIGSIAAIFATAISFMCDMRRYRSYSNRYRQTSVLMILGIILLPVAALIIQMSISRTREFAADEGSARLTGHPEWLITALMRLSEYTKKTTLTNVTSQTAHLFIVNPFGGRNALATLFSTHPRIEDRITKLKEMHI